MRSAGHLVKEISTTGPGSASEIAKRCIDLSADLILVAGGDGTINEVANGMIYSDVPLAILPGGTANVLAMETGIGSHTLQAAENLADWVPERIAVGVLSDGLERPPRYFLLMCGAGLDAHIVYNISASLKAALGKVSYWIGGFSQLGRRFPEFDVEANGQTYRCSFALISRVRNYGGDLNIAPTISMLDDEFEVVLFAGNNSFRYLSYMLGVVAGRVARTPGVTVLRTGTVHLKAGDRRIYTQVDGEYSGPLPATIQIVPKALNLLLPPGYRSSYTAAAAANAREWTASLTR
jgi:YegS/Rv2252/BmrU family lipid kinase